MRQLRYYREAFSGELDRMCFFRGLICESQNVFCVQSLTEGVTVYVQIDALETQSGVWGEPHGWQYGIWDMVFWPAPWTVTLEAHRQSRDF